MSELSWLNDIASVIRKYITSSYSGVGGVVPQIPVYTEEYPPTEEWTLNGVTYSVTFVDEKKAFKKHAWNEVKKWDSLLSEKCVIGIDGGSFRIRRDALHFIGCRAGWGCYSTKPDKIETVKMLAKSSLFFLIDSGLLLNVPEDLVARDGKIGFNNLDNAIFFVGWNPKKAPESQSIGLEARLRQLTEQLALRRVRNYLDSSELDLILIDGKLFPPSVRINEETLGTLKALSEKELKVCAVVKDTQLSVFIGALARRDSSINPYRYATDISFMKLFLKPLESSVFFTYQITGKEVDEEEWRPLSVYVKTSTGKVFRLEMPYYYLDLGLHHEIVKITLALSELNNGDIPRPIQLADSYFKYSVDERRRIALWLDAIFLNEKGIKLTKPYGEVL